MNIAIYSGMFNRDQDGATKCLYELTDTLLANRFNVGIWALKATPQQKTNLSLHIIPSVPLPIYPDYRIALPNQRVRRQLDQFKPDIIHITVPDLAGIFLMRYARERGIPVLTSFHTDFPSYLSSYHLDFLTGPLWRYFDWFYNQSEVVLAPTGNTALYLQDHNIKRVKLWPRGIHLSKYNPSFRSQALRKRWEAKNRTVILYSGRFVWYKDLDTVIRVYQLFQKQMPGEAVFVLAGDGPIKKELQTRMPQAFFPGYLTGKKLSEVYASADILLFPSCTEAFGNVVLEALASGVPAVVSDIGGCKEIVGKASAGFVVHAKNHRQFYKSCRSLILNQDLYKAFQTNGLLYARRQNWKSINRIVIDEYSRILQAGYNERHA
jgi:glycosyltransferase involved in cell wall biosynthesis